MKAVKDKMSMVWRRAFFMRAPAKMAGDPAWVTASIVPGDQRSAQTSLTGMPFRSLMGRVVGLRRLAMNVVLADRLPKSLIQRLTEAGFGVRDCAGASETTLPEVVEDAEILIVRSTRVSSATIEAGGRLRLIIRAGAGYNTINLRSASDKGVFVANCPGKNAIATAELAIGLMLSLDRRIPAADGEMKKGAWNKKEYSGADGVFGKRMGVVGLGRIGLEVVKRAQGLGMKVQCWSRSLTPQRAKELNVHRCDSIVELARSSDVVSIHLAATAETRGVVGEAFFTALPNRAILINTARAGIVDEEALLKCLDEGSIRYGADVFEGEPSSSVSPFKSAIAVHAGTVCTPHIGASTLQAQMAVSDEVFRIVEEFHSHGRALNCVNRCHKSRARWQMTVRHRNRVGVLASVLGAVRDEHINVEELENLIFEGRESACATIRLSGEPSASVLAQLGALEDVIEVSHLEIP
jgi:D-3-phosphoglycerate dehydrogenase / 2-oxoglutarate reductase